ncbi:tRNA pseudouridine(38-40) synthase TruA [Shouchella hunanensis]|uniref:tRNA pseudouridine synthase A n=1 Tax=Shouchella hunanensis TaxID=766894 RepID=A0ABY7WCB2_9BACI|nr:tRNA pseudouridine(38-40) synthase TruA [Shouchella hunanensis]WDF05485.1 tRNA pseudouridine(38-40) synthase TruA [Shouchella hunanensis]
MARYACKLAYDGTEYSGYQVQPQKRTVQAVIEQALTNIHKGERISVTASGRTDAGVHAKAQVIHFDSPLQMAPSNWVQALNVHLPNDVVVEEVSEVAENFHARFHTTGKEYRYYIHHGEVPNVFRRHYALHIKQSLDVPAMQTAAQYLLGTHDFSAFCASNTAVVDKVRTIASVSLHPNGGELEFTIAGNGFLYNMVRIIVGTLIEVGSGKRDAREIESILASKDRTLAGKTAPAQGLYLWHVDYENNPF